MLWSRNLRMAGRSRCHLRGSHAWRTGHRRSGPTGVSLPVARGSTGQVWMRTSACRVSWRVVDLVRRRSLFGDGSSGGNRLTERKPGEESVQAPISGLLDSGGLPETPRPPRGAKGAPGGGRTVPSVPEVADAGEDHGDAH